MRTREREREEIRGTERERVGESRGDIERKIERLREKE